MLRYNAGTEKITVKFFDVETGLVLPNSGLHHFGCGSFRYIIMCFTHPLLKMVQIVTETRN